MRAFTINSAPMSTTIDSQRIHAVHLAVVASREGYWRMLAAVCGWTESWDMIQNPCPIEH